MKNYLFIFFNIFLFENLFFAQNDFSFFFERYNDIRVKAKNRTIYYPWAGGLNFPQFSSVDLNFDGKKDLFLFEKHGNKILTFVKTDTIPVNFGFIYAPEYSKYFPYLHDWVLLRDYNCDGKEDIFSYSVGGACLYRNVSTTNSLAFEKVINIVNSYQGGNHPVNILITDIDIPSIEDVDNDGDLDIFTFHPLGVYLQFHKNESVELYGNCDSLAYRLYTNCWGNFAEGTNDNNITLNVNCPWKNFMQYKKESKHTGSTILVTDIDGDNGKDILLGDIGYSNIIALYNKNNSDSCHIMNVEYNFPSNDQPVNLPAMPAAYSIDVNGDGRKDLIFTPTQSTVGKNHHSVHLYLNHGDNFVPEYRFSLNDFLQNEMLDFGEGAYPLFFDYNNDSLIDVIVGNFGYYLYSYDSIGNLYSVYISQLALLKNIGTKEKPFFELVDTNYANVSSLGLKYAYPTFGDLNGDGRPDLVLGDSEGRIHILKNISTTSENDKFEIWYSPYPGIDVGSYSAPELYDLNNDNLLDLIVGEKYGKLVYFQNQGSMTQPYFVSTPTISQLGGVNVTFPELSNWGFTTPRIFKFNNNDYLITGSYKGNIFVYTDLHKGLSNENFTLISDSLINENIGFKTAACVYDINGDAILDVVCGNYAGGISCFMGKVVNNIDRRDSFAINNFKVYPNPVLAELNILCDDKIKKVEILSIDGKLINLIEGDNIKMVNFSMLDVGVYFVKFYGEESVNVKKVVRVF